MITPLGGVKLWKGGLILDDVNLFVVKGIKYRAKPGNYFGKTNYVIEREVVVPFDE